MTIASAFMDNSCDVPVTTIPMLHILEEIDLPVFEA